jgi:hypothetical protein
MTTANFWRLRFALMLTTSNMCERNLLGLKFVTLVDVTLLSECTGVIYVVAALHTVQLAKVHTESELAMMSFSMFARPLVTGVYVSDVNNDFPRAGTSPKTTREDVS